MKVYVVCYRILVAFDDHYCFETRLDKAYKEQDNAKKRVEYILNHVKEFERIDRCIKESCAGAFIKEVEVKYET